MPEEFKDDLASQKRMDAVKLPHKIDFNRGSFMLPFLIRMRSGRIEGEVDYQVVFQAYGYENADARKECFNLGADITRSLKKKFGEENIIGTTMGFTTGRKFSNSIEQLINAVQETR